MILKQFNAIWKLNRLTGLRQIGREIVLCVAHVAGNIKLKHRHVLMKGNSCVLTLKFRGCTKECSAYLSVGKDPIFIVDINPNLLSVSFPVSLQSTEKSRMFALIKIVQRLLFDVMFLSWWAFIRLRMDLCDTSEGLLHFSGLTVAQILFVLDGWNVLAECTYCPFTVWFFLVLKV